MSKILIIKKFELDCYYENITKTRQISEKKVDWPRFWRFKTEVRTETYPELGNLVYTASNPHAFYLSSDDIKQEKSSSNGRA